MQRLLQLMNSPHTLQKKVRNPTLCTLVAAGMFPFGKVKFTQAFHGSSLDNNEYMGEPAGVLLTMGGITVYHTGDTGLLGI